MTDSATKAADSTSSYKLAITSGQKYSRADVFHHYENVHLPPLLTRGSSSVDSLIKAQEDNSNQGEPVVRRKQNPRRKLASRQRALLLQRKRSRSLDEFAPSSYWNIEDSDYSVGDLSEHAVSKAVSIVTNSVLNPKSLLLVCSKASEESLASPSASSEYRRFKSMENLGSEGTSGVTYRDRGMEGGEAPERKSLTQSNSGIYDDPWNTEATLQRVVDMAVPAAMYADSTLTPEITQNNNNKTGTLTPQTTAEPDSDGTLDSRTGSGDERTLPIRHHTEPEYTNMVLSRVPFLASFSVDLGLPLLQQPWYHDDMKRDEADSLLKDKPIGSFIVRVNGTNKKDLSLTVRTADGVIHVRAIRQQDGKYILGQFSQPFNSAALMIKYYSEHKLDVDGAQHTLLTNPIPRQKGSLTRKKSSIRRIFSNPIKHSHK